MFVRKTSCAEWIELKYSKSSTWQFKNYRNVTTLWRNDGSKKANQKCSTILEIPDTARNSFFTIFPRPNVHIVCSTSWACTSINTDAAKIGFHFTRLCDRRRYDLHIFNSIKHCLLNSLSLYQYTTYFRTLNSKYISFKVILIWLK